MQQLDPTLASPRRTAVPCAAPAAAPGSGSGTGSGTGTGTRTEARTGAGVQHMGGHEGGSVDDGRGRRRPDTHDARDWRAKPWSGRGAGVGQGAPHAHAAEAVKACRVSQPAVAEHAGGGGAAIRGATAGVSVCSQAAGGVAGGGGGGGGGLGLWEGAGLGQKVAAAEAVVVELVTQLVAMGQPR